MANNIIVGANMVVYNAVSPTTLSGSVITILNTVLVYTFDSLGNLLSYQPGRGINGFSEMDRGLGDGRGYWLVAIVSFQLPNVLPSFL